MLHDTIADLLTRIRNANALYKERVDVPSSRIKKDIVKILKQEGFIRAYKIMDIGGKSTLRIYLKYGPQKERLINGLERVSRPSARVYVRKDKIPTVMGGLGVAIISTSQGVLTDSECRRRGIGGEVLCKVW
jgi:small subunit ribosomal protein S8